MRDLRDAMMKYVDILLAHRVRDSKRHSSSEPLQSPSNSSEVLVLPPRPNSLFLPVSVRSVIQETCEALSEVVEFEPIFLMICCHLFSETGIMCLSL